MDGDLAISASRMVTMPSLVPPVLNSATFIVYSEAEGYDRANVEVWRATLSNRKHHAAIVRQEGDILKVRLYDDSIRSINVRDLRDLRDLFPRDCDAVVDISGVGHEFWSGCMVALKSHVSALTYIYTEPYEYQASDIEASDLDVFDPSLFELSDRTLGLRALPGFVNLHSSEDQRSVFVPLLGFEGHRAMNVYNEIDPGPATVIPVVGVPGYRLEFPAYTLLCNKEFLETTNTLRQWRKAPASDPFAVKLVLEQIRSEYPKRHMFIAPIGTRPHALGALLYVCEHPEDSEILFDCPIRKSRSRRGRGSTHFYSILCEGSY